MKRKTKQKPPTAQMKSITLTQIEGDSITEVIIKSASFYTFTIFFIHEMLFF